MSGAQAMGAAPLRAASTGGVPAPAEAPLPPASAWLLRGLAIGFAWPLLVNLGLGRFTAFLGCAAGIGLLWLGARYLAEGLAQERRHRDTEDRSASVRPMKRVAIGAVAAAGLATAFGAGYALPMAVIFAALTGLGAWLCYGDDPVRDQGALDRRIRNAGLKPGEVTAALAEAASKIAGIENAAAALANTELKQRLARIVARARAILARVEAEPRDLVKARRFFVTYLDGTHDVVAKYAAQERDVRDPPLTGNLRRVLETVERVLDEQVSSLARAERDDLEVKIEVLSRQMREEGVR